YRDWSAPSRLLQQVAKYPQRPVQYLLRSVEMRGPAHPASPGCAYHPGLHQALIQPLTVDAGKAEGHYACTSLRCGGAEQARAGQGAYRLDEIGGALLQCFLYPPQSYLQQQ